MFASCKLYSIDMYMETKHTCYASVNLISRLTVNAAEMHALKN